MIRSAVLAGVGVKLSTLEPVHVALVGQVDVGRLVMIVLGLLVGLIATGIVLTCLCADVTHNRRAIRAARRQLPPLDLPTGPDTAPDAPDAVTSRVPNSRTPEPTATANRR